MEKDKKNRKITNFTYRLKPEDSIGVSIVGLYDRVAACLGLDPDKLCYDCTKINVSKNIQDNVFKMLDAQSSDPCYTGMMWVARGPKMDKELPDDTVELFAGFFLQNEKNVRLALKIEEQEAA